MSMSSSVTSYIEQYKDTSTRDILNKIRHLVLTIAPDATEDIAYGMPAYKVNGRPLVYYAAFSRHIGIYATPEAHTFFSKMLAPFKQGKGSVQFPLDQPIRYDIIEKIVRHNYERLKNRGS